MRKRGRAWQNVHEKVRRELYENRDEAYDTFNAALIPGVSDTIGVMRVPVLRALAKRLAKDGWEDYFKEADGTHEEKMIRAFLFAYVKNDDALEASARDFVPTIADWAVCDAFCQSYQTARRRTESTKEWIRRLAKSEREFEQRTACVAFAVAFFEDGVGVCAGDDLRCRLPWVLCADGKGLGARDGGDLSTAGSAGLFENL